MMTSKERFLRMYAHREADRVPILDSPWKETISRWQQEGMPTDDYVEYFDLDKAFRIKVDNSPQYPVEVIEETDAYSIHTTKWGATMRTWKNRTTTPEFLDFTVTTPQKWAEAKEQIVASDDRIPWDLLKKNYAKWRKEGYWLSGGFWFGFDVTHSGMVGTERLLIAMLEEPEWCQDMFEHLFEVNKQMMQKIWDAGYTFDEVHWYDDMGYKFAQFFSLNTYREVLKPIHQRAIDWAHEKGIKARLHSCGDIRPFVPELVGMGLDALNPMEVKAGMDPIAIKREFGDRLTLHGGVNAVLWDKPEQITQEIERVLPVLKQNGGYIFASDHSIPPDVSLEDFRAIIESVKRLGSY